MSTITNIYPASITIAKELQISWQSNFKTKQWSQIHAKKNGGSDGDQGKATTKINKMTHLPSERAKEESDGAKGTVKAKERREKV